MLHLNDLSLIELEPYIRGKAFTGKAKQYITIYEEDVTNFLTLLDTFPIARQVFDITEKAADFYAIYSDFKSRFKSDIRSEVFYAAKNGGIYKQIPSYCVYMLRKAWKECNGISNLICKVLPMNCIEVFCQDGYFLGGLSLYDAICNVCTPDYTPLSKRDYRVKNGDFYEIYISETDMVAIVPDAISNVLTDDAIANIHVNGHDLLVDGKPLRTLAGYVGAINSTYDLRELL